MGTHEECPRRKQVWTDNMVVMAQCWHELSFRFLQNPKNVANDLYATPRHSTLFLYNTSLAYPPSTHPSLGSRNCFHTHSCPCSCSHAITMYPRNTLVSSSVVPILPNGPTLPSQTPSPRLLYAPGTVYCPAPLIIISR